MNKNLKKRVRVADEQRKVNPLDLSADQDLTIALMNLVAIEDSTADTRIGEMVRNIRKKLMTRMIEDKKTQQQAYEYLSNLARDMSKANKLLAKGNKTEAYELYNTAYEAYVLYMATAYGISA